MDCRLTGGMRLRPECGMGMGLEPHCPGVVVVLEDQEQNESNQEEEDAHHSR